MILKRPSVVASHYAVSSGHGLATNAAMAILEAGGNAVDAGVAAGIALAVLHSDLVNFAGVAPIILRMADSGRVVTIDGLGYWPKAATIAQYEKHHGGGIPMGLLRTVIPAAPAAWIRALREFGSISFGEAAHAAIRYAREGFPMYPVFADFIRDNESAYRGWAENARIYLPHDRPPRVGEIFVQRDLADTLQYMADQEAAAGPDRVGGLRAAHAAFYTGDIAATICRYHQQHGGLLTREDLADYQVRLEAPLKARFAGCDFYCCGAWSQGVSMAQALSMLEASDARRHREHSADSIHHLVEIFKLVFADREQFVADPRFVAVPVGGLLDPAYLRTRLASIEAGRAFPGMPPHGDPAGGAGREGADPADPTPSCADRVDTGPLAADTSHACVIDRFGNMFAATPSDTSYDTPVIPGTGLCPSSRGSQSRGVSSSINALAPGKRPRLTPNPVIALRNGKPFMTLGTPGGDVQVQAMVQVLVNLLWFKMDVQAAIEAPRFASYSFPSSFAPNDYFPKLLMLEQRLDRGVGDELTARGHDVRWWGDWSAKAGGVCAIVADEAGCGLSAGADPRRAGLASGR
ncbi:MAG: gamma-glutamyltransferase [Lautropia sp.]